MINVNDYKKNYYSQNGEDGIIEFLYTQITPLNFVIEFGAADGLFCSNTARLWKDLKNVDALLIESDINLYQDLIKETSEYENVEIVNALVTDLEIYTNRIADLCSIDVDGEDYYIAKKIKTPHQIVIIEYNPTVPIHIEMIGSRGTMQGSSAKSIVIMMNEKNYTLVAATKTNLFFLYGDHHDKFETALDKLFDYSSLNYVVTSYDGKYDMIGEWGYGFGEPERLNLVSSNGLDKRQVYDSCTQEQMRQLSVKYIDDKQFLNSFRKNYNRKRIVE